MAAIKPGLSNQSLWFRDFDLVRHYLHLHGEAVLLGIAGVTAIVVFIQWALQLRRRPEVAIRWAWDIRGAGGNFDNHPWEVGHSLVTGPRQILEFRIAFENTGDALGEHTSYNLCAPRAFTMSFPSSPRSTARIFQGVSNRYTGPCTVLSEDEFVWMPGSFRVIFFTLEIPAYEGEFTLYFEVQSDRLNATGHRWMPSMVKWRNTAGHERSSWPRRHPGIIRRHPRSVESSPLTRWDRRVIDVQKGVQPHTVKI